ncbi:MAG TPA: tetratricopeptide repeat-containing glycosyltransferase family protein [Terriglobales bacterium]|nr:tetratricopeptide repeat-containing glycosyltransferase family protein [Terriglobales bacterium]
MKLSYEAPRVAQQQPDGSMRQERAQAPPLPPVIQSLLLKAVRLQRAGRLSEAARIYRQILAFDAEQADSLHLLGMIAYQAGGYELAVAMIRKAIAIKVAMNDDQASYHSNLGTVLQAQGNLDEAAACYERALTLEPESAEVHLNLGNIFQAQDKLDEAVACYERALALRPELAEAHHSMGNVLQAMNLQAIDLQTIDLQTQNEDKLDEAVACYERALALKPGYAQAHYNLGCALRSLGKVDEALVQFRRALALQPDYAQAGFRESLTQLLKGDFASGWRNYERRWLSYPKDHGTPMRTYRQPLWTGEKWTGEKLADGRLLIWGEQGVGDEIMFAGLIPDVLRSGNRCILDCDARLKPLFVRSFPGIGVISGCVSQQSSGRSSGQSSGESSGHDPELDIAAHLPCGSLPGLFRATRAAFAATKSPYLVADPVERERFRARYSHADGRRLVGLAWHTNNRKTGRLRSIDLSLFAPLFGRRDIRWIGLQYGDHDALQSQVAAASAPIFIDRSVDQLSDIDVFAAQIAAMDMVVTIDNSTAHLAGALGVSTMVLLPFAADWRWLQTREDSPWYPSLRLFRQPRRGDWQSVMQRLTSAL